MIPRLTHLVRSLFSRLKVTRRSKRCLALGRDVCPPILPLLETDMLPVPDELLPFIMRPITAEEDSESDTPCVSHNLLPLDTIYLYHQIWRALLRGDDTDPSHIRRPLPTELVQLISRFAYLCVPDSTHAFSSTVTEEICVGSKTRGRLTHLCFRTCAFDVAALRHIDAIQLLTTSDDDGRTAFPDRQSSTWLQWGIDSSGVEMVAQAEIESEAGGLKTNQGNIIAQSKAQHLIGSLVIVNDDMWTGIAEGSSVTLWARAMYPEWSDRRLGAGVRFLKWFKPTII